MSRNALPLALPLLAALLAPAHAAADEPKPGSYEAFLAEGTLTCFGDPAARLPAPERLEHGGFTIEHGGAVAKLRRQKPGTHPGEARFGVLSGIKDLEPATRANLSRFFAAFREADVDAVLVGGDTAYGEIELEEIFVELAKEGLPLLAIAGNNESRSAFHRSMLAAFRKHPNVVDLGLVRRVDGEGFTLISLPGTHDRTFSSTPGACVFGEAELAALPLIAREPAGPVLLLAHDPPRGGAKVSIDHVPGDGNVGDARLTELLRKADVRFVIAGHILEAGGRATDRAGNKAVPENQPAPELLLNPGQASSLPYAYSSGTTGYGMAAIVTLKDGRASYRLLRAPKPAP